MIRLHKGGNVNLKDENYIEMCFSLENMAGMIKKVKTSKEYKNGVRLQSYMNLIKKGKILEIIKRLTHNTSALNLILDTEDFQFDNSSEKFQSTERIAVYTALFGNYDKNEAPMIHPENIDYYIITDINIPKNSGWKIINPSLSTVKNISWESINYYKKLCLQIIH